jgi:hypothetical protein
MFQRKLGQPGGRDRTSDSCRLGSEEPRPAIVVRNDSYRLGFEAEWLAHATDPSAQIIPAESSPSAFPVQVHQSVGP